MPHPHLWTPLTFVFGRAGGSQPVSLVRNVDAVAALVRAFRKSRSLAVRERVLDACVNLLTVNRENYYILDKDRTLSPVFDDLGSLPFSLKVRLCRRREPSRRR